ncbi:MAG: hypothetical protein WC322_06250 [Candidatus Paceibacterota bacterium]|jgi:hypothetical protein
MANATENSLRNACYKNRFRVENTGTNAGNLELGTTIVGLVTTAGADSASIILGGGSSSYPVTTTTADKNFLAFYTESTATSGSARCQYNRLYVSGSGGAGDAVRNFLTCETNTPNTSSALTGTHSSLNFGSSAGNTYGTLGCATRSTLHIPDRGLTGSATALQAEIYCDGDAADVLGPTGTQNGSFIRFSLGGDATGIASIEDNANLFYLDGFTSASGNVYYGNTLRISVAGTNKYLVLSDAENSLTVDVSGVIYDDSSLSFGDSSDVTMTWAAGGGFSITAAADDTVFAIGNGTNSFDFYVYGDTASDYMAYDASTATLNIVKATATENQRSLYIDEEVSDTTHGVRQGAIGVSVNRASTAALASWDGNPDCGLKMQVYNRANNASGGATRGLDILARNRDATGATTWVNGGTITAENSTGSGGVTDLIGLEVHAKNNGVASGDVKCLRVYDESQSATGTSYGIELNCTADSAFTREYGIYINSGAGAGWTNGLTFDGTVTNPLDFADTDGTNGATYSAGHYSSLGNIDGKIRVDIGGNTLYVPAYASIEA